MQRLIRLAIPLVIFFLLTACQNLALIGGYEVENLALSPSDSKRYKAVIFDNGLRVLLVEDRFSDQSAAAMIVGVGSYDDPPDRQGLAHFTEHMLFLGTQRYPKPDSFTNFIIANGGRYNAYTASDRTNYFFDVNSDNFYSALDRFAQFFISPLFNPDYVDKERNAVESEYKLQSRDDSWRISVVQRQAMNPAHPASKFNIGSLKTLADHQTKVRADLIDFYSRYYRSDRMVLTMIGPHPLAVQLAWARKLFGPIKASEEIFAPEKIELFKPESLPAILHIKPEKELRTLTFNFPVPPLQARYQTKPGRYIASLLGDESDNSLYVLLKERGWIEAMSASSGPLWREDSFITVRIHLTKTGSQHWQKIGDALFAYIRYLAAQGINQWRFNEMSQMLALEFDFQSRVPPLHFVRQAASSMLDYPISDILKAPYIMDAWIPEMISEYLALLTPDRVLLSRVDPSLETDAVEPWFETQYQLKPLPDSIVARWQNASLPEPIALPAPNPFIPSNITLLATDESQKQPHPSVIKPQLLSSEDIWGWHMSDVSFGLPKTYFWLHLANPKLFPSPKTQANMALYLELVKDSLRSYTYPAGLAGLYHSLGADQGGITLFVGGYNDKQEVFLRKLLDTLLSTQIDLASVEKHRARLARRWRNSLKERPYVRNIVALQEALLFPAWRKQEMLPLLDNVTIESILDWRDQYFANPALSGFFYGNLGQAQAIHLSKVVKTAVPKSYPGPTRPTMELVNLEGTGGVIHQETTYHTDAALVLYVQGRNQSIAERAFFALFSQMIRGDYKQDIRTEKQLGYIAAVRNRTWIKTPGLLFVVQSPNSPASDLLAETRNFIRRYGDRLNKITPGEFYAYQKALIKQIARRDKSPQERAARLWGEINLRSLNFDSRERLAEAVARLTPQDMVNFYKDFMGYLTTRSLISYSSGASQNPITDEAFRPLDRFYQLKEESGRFSLLDSFEEGH